MAAARAAAATAAAPRRCHRHWRRRPSGRRRYWRAPGAGTVEERLQMDVAQPPFLQLADCPVSRGAILRGIGQARAVAVGQVVHRFHERRRAGPRPPLPPPPPALPPPSSAVLILWMTLRSIFSTGCWVAIRVAGSSEIKSANIPTTNVLRICLRPNLSRQFSWVSALFSLACHCCGHYPEARGPDQAPRKSPAGPRQA